jgi:hypothetical protein
MTVAALLLAAALGAALMAVWLWFAWHPDRARCALCRAAPDPRTAAGLGGIDTAVRAPRPSPVRSS